MKLNETAVLAGGGKKHFSESLDDFLGGLKRKVVDGASLVFGHFEGKKDGKVIVSLYPAGEYSGYKEAVFDCSCYPEELLNELEERKICFVKNNKIIFCSANVEFSEFGITGPYFIVPSKEAVIAIAKAASEKKVTVISRTNDGIEKVFAIRSAKYVPIDQRLIFSLVNEVEYACETSLVWSRFTIGNLMTELVLKLEAEGKRLQEEYRLPEDYVPYLVVQTSDTGDCSFRIREGWKKGNSLFYGGTVAHIHKGEFNEEDFAKVVRTEIFDKLCEFPKKLIEASEIFLSPMALETGADYNANKKSWEQTVRAISRYCGLTKAIGKKSEKIIVDDIIKSFNEAQFVTLYDAINEFLVLPETVLGLSKSAHRQMSDAVMKAVYYRPKETIIKVA